MRSIRVCICDYDKQYVEAFAKVVALRCRDMEISIEMDDVFTKNFDILLFNQRDMFKVADELRQNCMFLCDDPVEWDWNTLWQLPPDEIKIYKYEAVPRIISAIRLFHGSRNGNCNPMLAIHDPPMLIGFFSGAGGVGCTLGAVSLGKFLASEYKQKVLFLSFEDIDSSHCYFEMDHNMPSSDEYLYHFFSKNMDNPHILSGFLHTDLSGMEAFYPGAGENAFCRLHPDALYQFLHHVGNTGMYTCLVLDLSTVFSQQQAYLLQCCDFMVMCQGADDPRSTEKCDRKLKQLGREFSIELDCILRMGFSRSDLENGGAAGEQRTISGLQKGKEVKEIAEAIQERWNGKPSFGPRDYGGGPNGDQCKK